VHFQHLYLLNINLLIEKFEIVKCCEIYYVLPLVIAYRGWNRVVIWEFICVAQDILNASLVMLRNRFIDLSIQYLVNQGVLPLRR